MIMATTWLKFCARQTSKAYRKVNKCRPLVRIFFLFLSVSYCAKEFVYWGIFGFQVKRIRDLKKKDQSEYPYTTSRRSRTPRFMLCLWVTVNHLVCSTETVFLLIVTLENDRQWKEQIEIIVSLGNSNLRQVEPEIPVQVWLVWR